MPTPLAGTHRYQARIRVRPAVTMADLLAAHLPDPCTAKEIATTFHLALTTVHYRTRQLIQYGEITTEHRPGYGILQFLSHETALRVINYKRPPDLTRICAYCGDQFTVPRIEHGARYSQRVTCSLACQHWYIGDKLSEQDTKGEV